MGEEALDGEGSGQEESHWYDHLPEEIKSAEVVTQAPDLETFAKGYMDALAYQGNSIRIPGEEAGQEDWAKFDEKLIAKVPTLMRTPTTPEDEAAAFVRLGKPQEIKDYELPEIPEGVQVNDEYQNSMLEVAHKANLTKKQVKDLFGANNEFMKAQQEQITQAHNDSIGELKTEYGMKWDENLAMANKVKDSFFPFIGDDITNVGPDTIRAMVAIGEQLGTEAPQLNQQQGDSGVMVPGEAQNQIDEILRNSAHPYWDVADPGHARAKEHMIELLKMADPSAGTSIDDLRKGFHATP